MKKLQVLITHYKESVEVIKPLFDSIAMQKDIPYKDFSVIVVNDGEDVEIPQEFFDQYNFKIEYYIMPHGGISKARNYALSKATAKYIMWCDADDKFLVECAFFWIFREMKRPFNVLNSIFFEQKGDKGIPKKHDNTFIHGKVFNRQWLIDNDLKFDEELTVHEDGYFIVLAQSMTDDIRYFTSPFYVWVENPNSTARREGFIQDTWREYIKARDHLITELVRREMEDVARIVLAQFMLEARERNLNAQNMYYTAKLYEKFKELYGSLTKDEIEMIEKSASETFSHKVRLDTRYYDKLLEIG